MIRLVISPRFLELLRDALAAALLAVANVMVDALFAAVTKARRPGRDFGREGEPDL